MSESIPKPTNPSALPKWARDWLAGIGLQPDNRELCDRIIERIHGGPDLVSILDQPDIVKTLVKIETDMSDRGVHVQHAQSRIKSFLANACRVKWDAFRYTFRSPAQRADDLQQTADSARNLAKLLRTHESMFRGATTLAYLLEKRSAQHELRYHCRRLGSRYIDYEQRFTGDGFVPSPKLDQLLDELAADLGEQIEVEAINKKHTSRVKSGGPSAMRNYQVDEMIDISFIEFGRVHFTLIATVLSALNSFTVNESIVRKRAASKPDVSGDVNSA